MPCNASEWGERGDGKWQESKVEKFNLYKAKQEKIDGTKMLFMPTIICYRRVLEEGRGQENDMATMHMHLAVIDKRLLSYNSFNI